MKKIHLLFWMLGLAILLILLSSYFILLNETLISKHDKGVTAINTIVTTISFIIIVLINYKLLKEMEDTRIASLKPYIRIKRGSIDMKSVNLANDVELHYSVSSIFIKNYGNAPAVDIDVLIKLPYPRFSQSLGDWYITHRPLNTYKLFQDGNEIHHEYVSLDAGEELTFELIGELDLEDEQAKVLLGNKYNAEFEKAKEKYKDIINPYKLYKISIQYKDILGNSYNLIKETFPFPSGYEAAEEGIQEIKNRFSSK